MLAAADQVEQNAVETVLVTQHIRIREVLCPDRIRDLLLFHLHCEQIVHIFHHAGQ